MERPSFYMLKLIFLSLVISTSAHAFTISGGAGASFATSRADHTKWGVSLGLKLFEDSQWSFWSDTLFLMSTLTPVNPGAGNNPSAPDEAESYSGQSTLYSEVFLKTPWNLFGSDFSVGSIWYLPSIAHYYANSFSPALAAHFRWNSPKNESFTISPFLGFGFNLLKFTPVALIATPGVSFIFPLSKSFAIDLTAKILTVYTTDGLFYYLPLTTLKIAVLF